MTGKIELHRLVLRQGKFDGLHASFDGGLLPSLAGGCDLH
jgi:hypothetical protein